MILKPGDLVLFKSELTLQIPTTLYDLYITPEIFNKYKGTIAKVGSVIQGLNGRKFTFIPEHNYWWPSKVFEEDNEF